MIPAEIKTLAVIQPPNPSFVVLQPQDISSQNKIVPIWIGHTEALYLGMALERRRFKRPMTHDVLMDIITNLDGSIKQIVITKVEGMVFYSQIIIKQYDRTITIDARPSDALALAIRQGAPIFLDEEVINHMGCSFQLRSDTNIVSNEKELEEFSQFLSNLTPEDFSSL